MFEQTHSLKDRLAKLAKESRGRAERTPPGANGTRF
jgi:hypothetical protein